jgi:thymidine kinase
MGQEELEKADVIAFDEANFSSQLLVDLCEQLVDMKKRVIVAGLDQTFAGDPYGPMGDLMTIADEVNKVHAVCVVCGGLATKSQRLINGKPATKDSPQDIVGDNKAKKTDQGIVTYEARCRACYERAE